MTRLHTLALLIVSVFLLNTSICLAQTASSFQPNLLKSNWATGGSLGFEHFGSTSTIDSYNQFKLSLNVKYFVVDHLALGLMANVTTHDAGSSDTVANLGPAATYFFWTQDRLAAFVTGNARFGLNDATLVSILEGAVGIQYFFTQSVAFGPEFYFVHDTSHHEVNNRNDYGLEFDFGIYL